MKDERPLVVIRGGGDLGTGAAIRLQRAGWRVLVCELAQPLVIRRAVAVASAIYEGLIEVEGVRARRVETLERAERCWQDDGIAVMVDADRSIATRLQPLAMIDAIMAKHNTDTRLDDAPIVIALGPGFTAGVDCHAVVETNRGHNLGRVYYQGAPEADTGRPGKLGGQDSRRAIYSPAAGVFRGDKRIGDSVRASNRIADVAGRPIVTEIDGVVRGILHDGLRVPAGTKVADVDPRGEISYCFTVSDKAWAVGGGVLEAALYLKRRLAMGDY
jgi:xanthine dehydrogenase accessory factor